MASAYEEGLPQRKSRQRRRAAPAEEPSLQVSNSQDREGLPKAEGNILSMKSEQNELMAPEASPLSALVAVQEQNSGKMPEYRSAAEGNFNFECEDQMIAYVNLLIYKAVRNFNSFRCWAQTWTTLLTFRYIRVRNQLVRLIEYSIRFFI